ncbi:MAG TPA: SRPBCC family protein [Solirubrobacteraceae bacterium]|nr:SRPBCC family protein [Solirubrobacteraceae bacterium]
MSEGDSQITATARQVRTPTGGEGDACAAVLARTYATGIEDLWDACTNPERIPRWFLPVSGDLRVGGRFQLEGNAGGTIESCNPPTRFRATWEFGGAVSWIELRLTAVDADTTRLELEHTVSPDDATWARFGPGAVGIGWELGLSGLDRHLAGGVLDPAAAQVWVTSDEGRRFITQSSERWSRAALAAGIEAGTAGAWAARTTAFYTGAPQPD